ncbi:MAG: MFS transporter [Clostridia bacterium]
MFDFKKTLSKIFIGQTFSLLTSAIVQYIIVFYLTYKTGSAIVLALATIAGILPQIILGPFAGVLIDRLDRKKVMIYSDSLVALSTLVLVALFILGEPNVIWIYSILFVRSIGATFHTPSLQASIPLIVPKDKIVKVSGIMQTISSVTTIVAPVVAGILFGVVDTEYIIFLDIIGAIIGIGSLLLVKIPSPRKNISEMELIKEMKEGLYEIKKSPYLLIITLFVVIVSLIFMPVSSMFPLIISSYFKLSAIYISIIEVAFSAGMVIGGSLLIVWGGFKKKQYTIILSMLVFGIALAISGLVPVKLYFVFVAFVFIMGVAAPMFNGIYNSILQLKVHPDKLRQSIFNINKYDACSNSSWTFNLFSYSTKNRSK